MWSCPECGEESEEFFVVCWHCGSGRYHEAASEHDSSVLEDSSDDSLEASSKWQFTLRHLLTVIVVLSLILGAAVDVTGAMTALIFGSVLLFLSAMVFGCGIEMIQGIPVESQGAVFGKHSLTEIPLCLHCTNPVSAIDNYCDHCGQAVGNTVRYLPYETIWFQAGMWSKLWDRFWFKTYDSALVKLFYLLLIVNCAPILLLMIPRALYLRASIGRRSTGESRHKTLRQPNDSSPSDKAF